MSVHSCKREVRQHHKYDVAKLLQKRPKYQINYVNGSPYSWQLSNNQQGNKYGSM